MFVTKYNNLSFEYNNGHVFTIYEGNCEIQYGRTGGGKLIGICADKDVEDEPFCPYFVVTMIWEFQQSTGIKVHILPYGKVKKIITIQLKIN